MELWTGVFFFFLKILRQKCFNNNNQTSKIKVDRLMKVISKK